MKKIPFEELYRAYIRDRKLKQQPFMSLKTFQKSLEAMARKDRKGFERTLERSGWRMYK